MQGCDGKGCGDITGEYSGDGERKDQSSSELGGGV